MWEIPVRFVHPIVIILGAAIFLMGCSKKQEQSVCQQNDTYRLYMCVDGALLETDIGMVEGGEGEKAFAPWTIQERISGFAEINGVLFCAINRQGVIPFAVPATNGVGLQPFGTPENSSAIISSSILKTKTIGALFTYEETLFCHVYNNTLFSPIGLTTDPVFLLTLHPQERMFTPYDLPLEMEEGGWEAVEMLPGSGSTWFIRWKLSGNDRTQFRYYRYSPETLQVQQIDRESFRAAYVFKSRDAVPLQIQSVIQGLYGFPKPKIDGKPAVIHVVVRYPEFTAAERYRIGLSETLEKTHSNFVRMPGFRLGEMYVLLSPENELYIGSSDGTTRRIRLPVLPEDFVYTDLWTNGTVAFVAWEECRFPDVGRAGLVQLAVGLPEQP